MQFIWRCTEYDSIEGRVPVSQHFMTSEGLAAAWKGQNEFRQYDGPLILVEPEDGLVSLPHVRVILDALRKLSASERSLLGLPDPLDLSEIQRVASGGKPRL